MCQHKQNHSRENFELYWLCFTCLKWCFDFRRSYHCLYLMEFVYGLASHIHKLITCAKICMNVFYIESVFFFTFFIPFFPFHHLLMPLRTYLSRPKKLSNKKKISFCFFFLSFSFQYNLLLFVPSFLLFLFLF